jgi:hypothetical protein
MITIRLLLMMLAFLCLFAHALGVPASRVNLQSLGLALWVLALIIQ